MTNPAYPLPEFPVQDPPPPQPLIVADPAFPDETPDPAPVAPAPPVDLAPPPPPPAT